MTKRGELALVTLVLVLSGVFVLVALVLGQAWKQDRLEREDSGTIPPVSITCQEDMPCWDCTTMGNGRCGP
jgi:alkyl hydroperoxide reductase subunit AhpF